MAEDDVDLSPEAVRSRLTDLQWHVTQEHGTERAFTGEHWNRHDDGTYTCVVCGQELFSSDTKYDSGTGWPSFWQAVDPAKVTLRRDTSFGMVRTEVRCARCGAHLGHLFPDGPQPTGERFCMNSASLAFRSQPATTSPEPAKGDAMGGTARDEAGAETT